MVQISAKPLYQTLLGSQFLISICFAFSYPEPQMHTEVPGDADNGDCGDGSGHYDDRKRQPEQKITQIPFSLLCHMPGHSVALLWAAWMQLWK